MKKPRFFFDYIYYRLARLYLRWEGKNPSTAIVALMFLQFLIIGVMLIVISSIVVDRSHIARHKEYIRPIGTAVAILIVIWNYSKYYDRYDGLNEYWKNEPNKIRRQKGWIILSLYLIPMMILVLLILLKEGRFAS